MLLIVAEKPSAMRNFSKALGGNKGTYDNTEYEICSLRGHLLQYDDVKKQVGEDKSDFYSKWNLEKLPWKKEDFAFSKSVGKDCMEPLKNLKDKCKAADEVCIATDVDPSGEGELLAWEALEWAGWNGKTSRMYFTDEGVGPIQKAFKERKAIISMEKDGDYVKANARARWDYLSMQFTRIATCVARERGFTSVVRQGRLKSVMVALVGSQQAEYENYVKKPFFEARFKDQNGNMFMRVVENAEDIRFNTSEEVDLSSLHNSDIVEDSRQVKHSAPGKLLDLAGMSAILAKQGYKPKSVLATYQKMYEDQIVSYPRTEDKQITSEQFNELLPKINAIAAVVNVDTSLLTHREPRKTHVKDGGAHGANRPGLNVPASLDSLSKYGSEAAAIYELLAKNYLAILAEDFEYELVKGHVADFPDYVGKTQIPLKYGFKKVFDSELSSSDDENDEAGLEFSSPAEPFVFEGANKRPQKPTMKWLTKQLEKYNVGTGATRTSTLAEITANNDKALLKESKGNLSLTECGDVSYKLLDGCNIASPQVTEKLFSQMDKIGHFEIEDKVIFDELTDMVLHDIEQMKNNAPRLGTLSSSAKTIVGKCPKCGQDVYKIGKMLSCSSNKAEKQDDGTWKEISGCGFKGFTSFMGKKLTDTQIVELLNSKRILVKGILSKKTGKKFDAYAKLSAKANENGFYSFDLDGFPDRKK